MLHDAGRALGAQHAAIDRVVAVALDVADLAVLDVDVDAAAAGAHIAGGLAHLVARRAWTARPSGRMAWRLSLRQS